MKKYFFNSSSMAPVRCNEWVTVESTGFTRSCLFILISYIFHICICYMSSKLYNIHHNTTQNLMSFVEYDNTKNLNRKYIDIFNLLQRNKQRTKFLMLKESWVWGTSFPRLRRRKRQKVTFSWWTILKNFIKKSIHHPGWATNWRSYEDVSGPTSWLSGLWPVSSEASSSASSFGTARKRGQRGRWCTSPTSGRSSSGCWRPSSSP